MKLIKEIGVRQEAKRGYMWALFECPKCLKQIERRKHQGIPQEQCQECFRSYHRQTQVKHGDRYSRLYRTWVNMKARCNNQKNYNYAVYGGRGITICSQWDDYIIFKKWALSNGYTDNLTIDRVDVNGNYEPNNCQWITSSENSRKDTIVVNKELLHEMKEFKTTNNITVHQLCTKFNVSQTAYYNARKRYENNNNT